MSVRRSDPPYSAEERRMLETWLDYHRATLEMKCEGLAVEQLRERAVPPSSLSLLGLVRHMTEVERNWFQRVLAGEDVGPLYCSDANPDGDFDDVDGANGDEALAMWRTECERARQLVGAFGSLGDVGKKLRRGELVSLRWIMVHMIEEYARHNGHADLLRERIDGTVGD